VGRARRGRVGKQQHGGVERRRSRKKKKSAETRSRAAPPANCVLPKNPARAGEGSTQTPGPTQPRHTVSRIRTVRSDRHATRRPLSSIRPSWLLLLLWWSTLLLLLVVAERYGDRVRQCGYRRAPFARCCCCARRKINDDGPPNATPPRFYSCNDNDNNGPVVAAPNNNIIHEK